MFPFNLAGPQFLVFYLFFALIVLIICWIATRMVGGSASRSYAELTSDPYQIAYLRSGPDEMIKIAVFNLVDRGFLEYDDGRVKAVARHDASALRRPIDRTLVSKCATVRKPADLLDNAAIKLECDKYKADLERRGLLPDREARRGHVKALLVAVSLLAGVALVKIVMALASGRTNVFFLVIFAIAASLFAVMACVPRVSPTGRAAMSGLGTLLRRLRGNADRLRAGGSSNEALLLAAVAGLAALPAAEFASARQMFPLEKPFDGGNSSGSSSDSGGCGGGGGCGGCGG